MNDSTLKPELLQRYAGDRNVFIETGTSRGEGLQTAIDFGFEKYFSVEANAEVYSKACTRFAGQPNVELLLGDGGQVLNGLLRYVTEPAVFWLDSHWSTGEAPLAQGVDPCPLLAELRAIAEHHVKDHVILIDDIRYFWKGIAQWNNITVNDILQMVLDVNPLYWVRFEEGVGPVDILVATLDPNERRCRLHEAVEAYDGMQ